MSRKSLYCFQGSRPRCNHQRDLTLYRASNPAPYTVGAVPVKPSGGVPFLDCAHSIAPCAHSVNTFFKKIFGGNFFKDNENARARRGSQNRRKQAKTEVLSAEKFFCKNQKKRAKKIFPVVLRDSTAPRQHRAPIDRGTADRVHQKRCSIENYMV